MNCCTYLLNHTYTGFCLFRDEETPEEPLAEWEKELLRPSEMQSDVVLTLEGGNTLEFQNVRIDAVGPSAQQKGIIGIEFADDLDRLVHVPNVLWWEFNHVWR